MEHFWTCVFSTKIVSGRLRRVSKCNLRAQHSHSGAAVRPKRPNHSAGNSCPDSRAICMLQHQCRTSHCRIHSICLVSRQAAHLMPECYAASTNDDQRHPSVHLVEPPTNTPLSRRLSRPWQNAIGGYPQELQPSVPIQELDAPFPGLNTPRRCEPSFSRLICWFPVDSVSDRWG